MLKLSNERIEWIDLSRCIAILCVIICHCIDTVYSLKVSAIPSLSLPSMTFAFSALSLGRLGVPIFLMITGYLLLDREYDNQRTERFWNKNVKHLVICALFWAIVSELFLILVLHKNIALDDLFFGIIFLKPLSLVYFWYMPMILAMYVFIPFVANALQKYDLSVIVKPTFCFAIVTFLIPFIMSLLKFHGITDYSPELFLGFSGGAFGIYMIMGYIIKKGYFKRIKTRVMGLIFILAFIIFVLIKIYYFNIGFDVHIFYESPFILICAISLFELISRIKHVRFYNIIYKISIYSFGIFLVHDLYRMFLRHRILHLTMSNPLKFVIYYIIVFALSLITVIIISKIPKFGKYVLHIK